MKPDQLLRCTFTGIDEFCSLELVKELSQNFPFVEWGVLLSTSENSSFGRNRYPSLIWLQDNLPKLKKIVDETGSSIALHVCGKESKKLLEQSDDSAALNLISFINRVQINFIHKEHQIAQLEALCAAYPNVKFITQHNRANETLYKKVKAPNHQVLFDTSGGRGIETTDWLSPLEGKVCGYAGGLGPDNVSKQLDSILTVAHEPFWIDMEGKIRADDLLDLSLCKDVLQKVSQKFSKKLCMT